MLDVFIELLGILFYIWLIYFIFRKIKSLSSKPFNEQKEHKKKESPKDNIKSRRNAPSYTGSYDDKGAYGEFLIHKELINRSNTGRVLTNLYIPKENGTTEIDILFIHRTGIYVIESKNYGGWIYGRESDYKWTQVVGGGKKYHFYNPIKQNETHLKHLKKLLKDIHPNHFSSLIVFGERCELKKIDLCSSNIKVIKRYDLYKTMRELTKDSSTVFTDEEVDDICGILEGYSNTSNVEKCEHIRKVSSLIIQ